MLSLSKEVLSEIDKKAGKGSLIKMSEQPLVSVDAIPTGCLTLDEALGIGGFPRGRIVEIYGPESTGKTTIALSVVAEAQKRGGECVYIDAEHALDPAYAEILGVNVEDLYVLQPNSGEEALDVVDLLSHSGEVDVIVIDSVAALVPRAEIAGDMGDSHVGLHARLMSQALRKLNGTLARSNTLCIFINQLRSKIGVMYGSPETTTGGNALKFYSSVRLDIRRIESLKEGAEIVGNRARVKVVKNKVGIPFRQAEFDVMYGKGINKLGALIDVAVAREVIKRSGAWYAYGETQLGQGREKTQQFLSENEELLQEIEGKVRSLIENAS